MEKFKEKLKMVMCYERAKNLLHQFCFKLVNPTDNLKFNYLFME